MASLHGLQTLLFPLRIFFLRVYNGEVINQLAKDSVRDESLVCFFLKRHATVSKKGMRIPERVLPNDRLEEFED